MSKYGTQPMHKVKINALLNILSLFENNTKNL